MLLRLLPLLPTLAASVNNFVILLFLLAVNNLLFTLPA